MHFTTTLMSIAGLLVAGSTASPIKTRAASTNGTYSTGGLQRWAGPYADTFLTKTNATVLAKRADPIFTWGDEDDGGIGVIVQNSGNAWDGFYMYANGADSSPYKYTWIAAGDSVFLSVPSGFQGRITRGTDAMNLGGVPNLLGSWFEFSMDPIVPTTMWADVSLIKGCDGPLTIANTDGQNLKRGFSQDIVDDGPTGAYQQRSDGNWVLGYTEALGSIPANTIALNWELEQVGASNAYLDDAHGSPVIDSLNGRFEVTFFQMEYV